MSGFKKPQPKSSVSHWIASNRGPQSLDGFGATEPLPDKADIAIIGAGISGALLAYTLTRSEGSGRSSPKGSRIIILEGAEVASSSTGRNGGHFAPATFLSFKRLVKPVKDGGVGLTASEAVHILCQEWDNFNLNKAVIKKHDLAAKVDFWDGKVMTVYETEEQLQEAVTAFQNWSSALKEYGVQDDYSGNVFISDREEAVKVSRVTKAIGCSLRNAGSVHPHKFTTELLKLAISSPDHTCSLWTNTPLVEWKKNEPSSTSSKGSLDLITPRGKVQTFQAILCTNAHTPHLFPQGHALKEFIFPLRMQMGLITPPSSFSGVNALATTYGFPRGYCATSSGGIVVGLSVSDFIQDGTAKPQDFISNSDDSELLPELIPHFQTFMKDTMAGWGEQAVGEGLTRSWMGVMALTIDRLPLVGAVPGQTGLYIMAGFNGHGMSTTHTSARAMATLLLEDRWDQDFPPQYIISEERLKRKVHDDDYVLLVTGKQAPVRHLTSDV